MTIKRVGLIGVGLMGHGIGKNILAKGYHLTVMAHRNRGPVDDLVAKGAHERNNPLAVAKESDLVILCVTGSPQVEHIIHGEYGLINAMRPGLIVADSVIDHFDFIKTFALLHDLEVRGSRVAVIANAGYEKTYAADNLGELSLAELDAKTLEKLQKIIFPYVKAGPLLDLTGMATDEMFEQCVDVLLSSSRVDALCISIVPQAADIHTTDEEIDSYEENVAVRIVRMARLHKKPVVLSVNVVSGAGASYNRFGQVLEAGGVPTFYTAERAMVCLNEFVRYHLIREKHLLSEWLK